MCYHVPTQRFSNLNVPVQFFSTFKLRLIYLKRFKFIFNAKNRIFNYNFRQLNPIQIFTHLLFKLK